VDAFLNPARLALWPSGHSRLHVYLLPDLTVDRELAALIGGCREVLGGFADAVQIVGDPWLHTTVQMVARPAADITDDQRRQLIDRLRHHLSILAPFRLSCGSPLATLSSVLLDQDGDAPGGSFTVIHTHVRQAIRDVLGDDVLAYDTLPPHLTIGYGAGPADSGRIGSTLRKQVRPSHAAMTVAAVWLVDVTQHIDPVGYQWETVARIALDGQP